MPYQVDVHRNLLFGDARAKDWLGLPLLTSLRYPKNDVEIKLQIEGRSTAEKVLVLNCIDFLYGHSLLKLLNLEHHLKENYELDIIAIVPKFLRWMVPEGVAEIWTVDISLSDSQHFFPLLHRKITRELQRFSTIYVSHAHSHPKCFDITRFTGVEKHDFARTEFRVSFVWREDRPWCNDGFFIRVARKFAAMKQLLHVQNNKIRQMFSVLRHNLPQTIFTVVGLGTATKFPDWIEDHRVSQFTEDIERKFCKIYAESRVVIGVHGSNLLLPSAHAGMTLDLMPSDRWANIAQDILYQEQDSRLASFRYRFLPITSPPALVAHMASSQLQGYSYFRRQMFESVSL
jgi:hypothetical protein